MAAGGSYSIVEYFGGDGGYRCGYCKHENGNFSHGMWSHTMTVQDYQDLIDRGWRRSGKYVYKPLMNKTCCPQYTIRCHALNFHPSKTHKKTLKKVNRFLSKGEMPVERHDEGLEGEPMDSAHEAGVQPPRQDLLKIDHSEVQDISTSPDTDTTNSTAPITPREDAVPAPAEKTPNVTPKSVPVSFEDPDFLASYEQSAALYARYQTTVHGDSPYECGESEAETAPDGPDVGYGSFHQQYWLDGRIVAVGVLDILPSCVSSVYLYYHPEFSSLSLGTYSALRLAETAPDGPDVGYGSFHQQYWLDGRIVAVGVLDILPSCVSSVYLYYHPEFSSLSLGTYSALREIAFTRQLQQQSPKLAYYYLGFYVHSCPKMRYKPHTWLVDGFANKGLGAVFKLGCRTMEADSKAVQQELYVNVDIALPDQLV
ncbi:arginyl-tRNA--protein transferase 1-like [Sinocyclocheilus grahami]|uniref:arginyl-tRNA--protein transferase 1-like n=1 Tax=Sinocyclocheilus grahami TaxID=75366 RepID=UPI0007AD3322|nr:PREDICTED: arginyl-tRNA--protein transferase 1-like [Sinocyclocheilus grahami]